MPEARVLSIALDEGDGRRRQARWTVELRGEDRDGTSRAAAVSARACMTARGEATTVLTSRGFGTSDALIASSIDPEARALSTVMIGVPLSGVSMKPSAAAGGMACGMGGWEQYFRRTGSDR